MLQLLMAEERYAIATWEVIELAELRRGEEIEIAGGSVVVRRVR